MVEVDGPMKIEDLEEFLREAQAAKIPEGAVITGWILDHWSANARVSLSWEKRGE